MTPTQVQALAHKRSAEAQAAQKRENALRDAAPDLLAAAQLMLAWFKADQFHSEAGFHQRMQMCRDAEDAMLRAVAKATGDTP